MSTGLTYLDRAILLVDAVIAHTIGLVTSTEHQHAPVIADLMVTFRPPELDALVQPAATAG